MIGLLVPQSGQNLESFSIPTTEDRGPLGLRGLKTFLQQNNIPNISLRNRYQSLLFELDVPERGNLIVINQPSVTESSRAELDSLSEWLRQGNFALILVARQDRPDWVEGLSLWDTGKVLDALDLKLSILPDKDDTAEDDSSEDETDTASESTQGSNENLVDDDTDEHQAGVTLSLVRDVLTNKLRKESTLRPMIDYPLLQGIDSISSFYSTMNLNPLLTLAGRPGGRYSLSLLKREKDEGAAFWAFRHGEGGGWVSSQPDMFGNVTLGRQDNAQLFSNIVNQVLVADGSVIFDDMHLGLSDLYDPDNFFSDARLHNTLWLIGFFWIIYMVGYSNRLAPVKQKVDAPNAVGFVEAMSGYFVRKTPVSVVAQKLLQHFNNEVRDFYRQGASDKSATTLLRSQSSVEVKDINELELLTQKISNDKAVNLLQLIRTIDRIKRMMK